MTTSTKREIDKVTCRKSQHNVMSTRSDSSESTEAEQQSFYTGPTDRQRATVVVL